MAKGRKPRRIAPRLANGKPRESWAGRLPDYIKQGIAMRAYADNKSVSFYMEEWIIDNFGFKRPEYVKPKQQTDEEKARDRGTLRRVK